MGDEVLNDGFDTEAWSFNGKIDLDPRLVCSLGDLGFSAPTDVQQISIPLIYEGKDVYMQFRTGSGKTAAYLVPTIERILRAEDHGVRIIILVPTRDLSWQVADFVERLVKYCKIKVADLCKFGESRGDEIRRGTFSILVSTPTRLLDCIKKKYVHFKNRLDTLVMDEADLILSYGYKSDTLEVLSFIPKGYQVCMASATLSMDLCTVVGLTLKDLAIVKSDSPPPDSSVRHYYVLCSKQDRYLYLCYMLKFRMNPFGSGKTLVFVNSVDEGYRLRVLLDLFGIRCCSLNPNLPIESRVHIIQEFNKGIYDHIIAVDQRATSMVKGSESSRTLEDKWENTLSYGSARGIDFKGVNSVINFDFPLDSTGYIHRAGRTGRSTYKRGVVLSFFIAPPTLNPMDLNEELKGTTFLDTLTTCRDRNISLNLFSFSAEDIEPFRYRVENALRAVTKRAIKYAKVTEIRNEILNSEKLKSLLESDSRLLPSLRHNSSLINAKVESNLSHVPRYLLPRSLATHTVSQNSFSCLGSLLNAPMKRKSTRKRKKHHSDPLKSFKCV